VIVVVVFGVTVTEALKFPEPSAMVVAAGRLLQVPFLKILTVAPGSVIPTTEGEPLFDGDAGIVPLMMGAGGVAIVTEYDARSYDEWLAPAWAMLNEHNTLKTAYLNILISYSPYFWKSLTNYLAKRQ
jgi:hypothetical protein